MQPTHVFRRIVKGDVVVERSVDRSRAQTVRNGKNDQHPKSVGKGKSEQRDRRKKYAADGDDARAELSRQFIRKKTGYDRSSRYDHGNDAHKGDRNVQVVMDDGPARAEKGIGKPEADKSDINKSK